MRGAPQRRLAWLMLRMRSRTSLDTDGRPLLGRLFHLRYSRKPCRCHATTVSGLTMTTANRQAVHNLDSQTHKRRSVARKRTRWPLGERCRTRSWWRKARISTCRVARVRKQEDTEKSSETKRVTIALAAYTPRLYKFNRFNKSGPFGRDNRVGNLLQKAGALPAAAN